MGKVGAIILAAGKGLRMKAGINKQFICIEEKPILYYTLNAFARNEFIDEIILVAARDEIDYCKNMIVDKYNIPKVTKVIEGGEERYNSVYNGLISLENCDIVLIHDGARPFVSNKIINEGINFSKIYGAAACGVIPKDTIKIRDNEGMSKSSLERKKLFCVQTPQCFKYSLILEAHKKLANRETVTDDTTVVESFGSKVYLYEGDYFNIKITTPEDLILAKSILTFQK